MATIQTFQYQDNSTAANFRAWGSAISNAFSTFGWVQSSDTGQINWTTVTNPTTSGAFAGYEIWTPNDGLTPFYVKIEYGNANSTNAATVRLTVSSSTNGAGTSTGFLMGPYQLVSSAGGNATTQFEMDFSGALGRFGAMLWRSSSSPAPQFFSIERSLNSSGAYTGTHVTLNMCGNQSSGQSARQQTLLLSVGPGPFGNNNTSAYGWSARNLGTSASVSFNNSIPFDTPSPMIGYWDYPLTACGVVPSADVTEGVQFTVSLYGATRNYIPSKVGNFGFGNLMLCMRYD